ncbi:hypothetical protein BKK81_33925 (plasmid) [Cupriavidus sp. USMAHM13]|nr:hypothetical protein BKK81_33925 [Cupriavidus sp. USMAHM13]
MAAAALSASSLLHLLQRSHSSGFAQTYRAFQQMLRTWGIPDFDIAMAGSIGHRFAVDEAVIVRTPFCDLRSFERRNGQRRGRILLCAPLAGHHAVLMRETVASLLEDADVYVTDWLDARDIPFSAGPFGIDAFVLTLQQFITALEPRGLDILAVCQATVPALAAVSRLAEEGKPEPRSLILVGGPIDARLHPTQLDRMAMHLAPGWLEAAAMGTVPPGYPGAGRRVYPGFLQYPVLLWAQPEQQIRMLRDLRDHWLVNPGCVPAVRSRSMAAYCAMLDMTAEFVLDTLRVVFQEFQLPQGNWCVDGSIVRPQCLRETELLTVEGDRDSITGAGQTHAAQALCSGLPPERRAEWTIPGCDHYGLFSGPTWQEVVYPALRHWLATHKLPVTVTNGNFACRDVPASRPARASASGPN